MRSCSPTPTAFSFSPFRDTVEVALPGTYVADGLTLPVHAPVAALAAGVGACAAISTPVVAGNQRGRLILGRFVPGRTWTDADAQLLRGVANVYGRALETARAQQLLALPYAEGPIAFSIRLADATLVDCNQRYLDLHGLTREEADQTPLSEMIDPEGLEVMLGATTSLGRGEPDRASRDVRSLQDTDPPTWFRTTAVCLRTGESTEPLFLTSVEDITEVHAERESLEWVAEHDSLTGVASRFAMLERIDETAGRTGRLPDLLLTDLDRFKLINDSMGGRCCGDGRPVGRR